jgi:hypothetical protein
MIWYNVNLINNRRWDVEMKRLAKRSPKPTTRRSKNAKKSDKIAWLKKRRSPELR